MSETQTLIQYCYTACQLYHYLRYGMENNISYEEMINRFKSAFENSELYDAEVLTILDEEYIKGIIIPLQLKEILGDEG